MTKLNDINEAQTRTPALTHTIPQHTCAATVETSHTVPNVRDMKMDTLKLGSIHEMLI